jgi:rhodanese-related sulfurtransferase
MLTQDTQDDSDDWMSALLRSPIFQRLPPTNLQKILMSLEAAHFSKGEVIVEQGTMGDYYYLIKNGHCELTRKPSPTAKEIKLAQMSAGDTFGEDSLLSDAPRNGSIRALTDISLLRLNKAQFVSLIKEPSLTFVNYMEMQEAMKQGTMLLDVRTPDEYEKHHIEGSINEPFFSLRMQLKTLDRETPIIVVCSDGKISEAAVFLLLRHKINAMILKGGMKGIEPQQEDEIAPASPVEDINVADDVNAIVEKRVSERRKQKQKKASSTAENIGGIVHPPETIAQGEVKQSGSVSSSVQDNQIAALRSEIEAIKAANQQLTDKCMKLEFDKQHAEQQNRILHKQLAKLTQVLDKFKEG